MLTLGINAAYHDSAACLVRDGDVVAAAEEERFTRIKHGKRPVPFSAWELPYHAVDYCLAAAGVELADLDHVAYSFDPYQLLTTRDATMTLPLEPSAARSAGLAPWEPLFLSYIVNAERQLVDGVPHRLHSRFRSAKERRRWQWHFVEHHLAHEVSAFLPSPFDDAAVLTLDGRGEKTATSYGHFANGEYRRLKQVALPSSLGLLYEQVTDYLGFLRSSDEYKVMAVASYGKPRYVDWFRDVVELTGEGCYVLHPARLEERFGPKRQRGAPLTQQHFDIAHSLQAVLEETVISLASWLRRETASPNLCMAGGVALNCVLNGRLREQRIFDQIFVQPAAGDAGTALGAALWVDWETGSRAHRYRMEHAYLGPEFSADEIEADLQRSKQKYRRLTDVAGEAAELLAAERILGWFQGRMEFGPRALGARSILASPLQASMQQRLNEIKDREDFRPVAPAVLEEAAAEWFVGAERAPFMLFVFDVVPAKAHLIPAVRHVDGTARVQTVGKHEQPLYHELLRVFGQRTGVPVLVNTSFNSRGEPVVCTPRDALESFWSTPLDALVIGPFLIEKPL
jgi:carbamoyltransferase